MVERRINFGPGDGSGKYRIEDTGSPGDFVLAEDTSGQTVLLQWNDTAGQWEYGGPVDMGGEDVSNVGTLSATAINTDIIEVGEGRQETVAIPQSNYDSDSDNTTSLNLSLSGLSGNDEGRLVIVTNGNGSVATGDVEIQINGVTSDYDQVVQNGGTLTNQSGLSAFNYQVFEQATRRHRFSITAAGDQTEIKQLTGGSVNRNIIINGDTDSLGSGINSVSVKTTFNASGRAYLIDVADAAP